MLQYFLVKQGTQVYKHSRRTFYLWLNNIFNRVDDERRKRVGAERVAAEWILRCGGGVKFSVLNRYIWDYNALPEWTRNKYQVEGINAKNTYITDGGLDHLVQDTLEELDIGSCSEVQDLSPLLQLQNLKKLNVSGTTSIKGKDSIVQHLKKKLPDCVIMSD